MTEENDTPSDVALAWSSINVSGSEATLFLQGQLSQDVASLDSSGVWSLVLAPDSVVITSTYVTAVPEGYSLVVPSELADATLTRLRRFLLRTDCTLDVVASERGPYGSVREQISAGRPGPAEFSRGLTPQSFGASFVASTISFTKGCFTGQELVGRLDARGSSVPWRMVRATGPSASRVTEVLTSKGPAGPSGLTTYLARGASVVGLGFAHRSLFGSEEQSLAGDVDVEEIR